MVVEVHSRFQILWKTVESWVGEEPTVNVRWHRFSFDQGVEQLVIVHPLDLRDAAGFRGPN